LTEAFMLRSSHLNFSSLGPLPKVLIFLHVSEAVRNVILPAV
jgi:hypothetical protein